jgi:hypothetical protein
MAHTGARRTRIVAVSVSAALAVTACTASAGTGNDSSTSVEKAAAWVSPGNLDHQDQLSALVWAVEHDAYLEQIDILSREPLTWEGYTEAMNNAFQCAKDAGRDVVGIRTENRHGRDVWTFTGVSLDPDGTSTSWDRCEEGHALWVDWAWQATAPGRRDQVEHEQAQFAEPLRQCLIGYGVDIVNDASWDELLNAASNHWLDTNMSEDCIADIGMASADD